MTQRSLVAYGPPLVTGELGILAVLDNQEIFFIMAHLSQDRSVL
ncbi:MAG: hypothetical protein ACTHW1_09630 [Ancrocorticia sp.]